jgi:hypothetical protein
MNVLISVAGNWGSPFQSPPSTVRRGNIINTTNPDDLSFRLLLDN